MTLDPLADLRALCALAALLLLPGILVVRSAWTWVPFLSVAYWLCCWGWLPAGGSRIASMEAMILGFAILALLRLPRLPRRLVPGWPSVAIAAVALLECAPFAFWSVSPAPDAATSAARVRCLVWRDGPAKDYWPLVAGGFGGPGAGLEAWTADVALLGRDEPHRAALLANLASRGLLLVAAYGFLRRRWSDGRAVAAAIVVLALTGLGTLAGAWSPGGPLVPAFLLASLAVGVAGHTRSAAVAAGFFLAAAMTLEPLCSLAVGSVMLGAMIVTWGPKAVPRPAWDRCACFLVAAAVAGLPFVLRFGLGDASRWPAATVAGAVAGILIALHRAPEMRRWPAGDRWVGLALIVVALAVVLRLAGDFSTRTATASLDPGLVAALRFVRDEASPTATVCAPAGAATSWAPAIAGRVVSVESSGRRPCSYAVVSGMSVGAVEQFRSGNWAVLRTGAQ